MGRTDQAGSRLVRIVRLTIDDFGLIAHASLEFADGLTIFSGETGSGKTMLLGALRFGLGERADSEMIRGGALRARVVVEIEPDEVLRTLLAGMGIAIAADDDVIVTRELQAGGRSQARINGVAASASQLRTVAERVVDVVGQHEAQRLLAAAFALEVVDRFGGPELARVAAAVRDANAELRAVDEDLASARNQDGRSLAQVEFARFAIGEIDAAALEPDEEQRLRERRDVLANAEKIAGALTVASMALNGEGGAVDALGAATVALASVARFGEQFASLADGLAALQSDVTEAAGHILRERDAIEGDPAELELVQARLEQIDRLKRKYGGSVAAIAASRAEFTALIERDAGRDERIATLSERSAHLAAQLDGDAANLSARRRAAARELERRVDIELRDLAMPAAHFSVGFEPLDRIGAGGAERAQLRLSSNPGEPERAIARSASGGELSRVLLALIVATADRRDRTALVFDEIDAGIGGATAVAVGTRLGRLAGSAQVVVVTHLAQIASLAHTHYALRKREVDGGTVIELETLDSRQARLEEIARMLSGQANPVSLRHAATLVAGARAR